MDMEEDALKKKKQHLNNLCVIIISQLYGVNGEIISLAVTDF